MNLKKEVFKEEVLIVFAFVIYFVVKIVLFLSDRLCGVQKEKMQYHGMKAVYDERGRKVNDVRGEPVFYQFPNMIWLSGTILLKPKSSEKPKTFRLVTTGE